MNWTFLVLISITIRKFKFWIKNIEHNIFRQRIRVLNYFNKMILPPNLPPYKLQSASTHMSVWVDQRQMWRDAKGRWVEK